VRGTYEPGLTSRRVRLTESQIPVGGSDLAWGRTYLFEDDEVEGAARELLHES